jgi:predicted nucleic acid-binding protein
MPVLDTNFLIALEMRDPAAVALLEEIRHEDLLVPSIVAVEYLTTHGPDPSDAQVALARAFTLIHTDASWIETAARLRRKLRSKKRPIRLADFWIAAFAVHHDTHVISRDTEHFDAMGVRTRTW